MSLRDIPRTAIGGYLKVARWPLDRTTRLFRRGGERTTVELAVDQADATVRDAAGRIIRDDELQRDAARRKTATSQRGRAKSLREEAERKQRSAAQAEQRRKAASAKAAAERQERIERETRTERLEALDEEAEALDKHEEALTAADEAQRLRDAAGRVKAGRNNSAPSA
jgi:hypothetical protein